MRLRIAAAFVVAGALPGAYACVDLFHSTADVLDKCAIDAASCPLDFCALTPQTAEDYAERACAWLGACESPLGGNAFGPCMVQARLAFDCRLNPNHPVQGPTHALWECLARVRTCGDVSQCVAPGATAACRGATTSDAVCLNSGSNTTRIACLGGIAVAENCALWGQTCDPNASSAVCGLSAGGGLDCAGDGAPGSCDPTTQALYWCGDAGEVAFDCTGNGAGRCGVFPNPETTPSWPACVPEADGGCAPGLSVSCANDIATSCPTGVPETLDCARLLGMPGTCRDAGLDPPFDWTSPCSSGAACQDSCDAGILTGCARGASFVTDCAQAGLGDCQLVTTLDDAGLRAACSLQ
jgi:hypothetical protein